MGAHTQIAHAVVSALPIVACLVAVCDKRHIVPCQVFTLACTMVVKLNTHVHVPVDWIAVLGLSAPRADIKHV